MQLFRPAGSSRRLLITRRRCSYHPKAAMVEARREQAWEEFMPPSRLADRDGGDAAVVLAGLLLSQFREALQQSTTGGKGRKPPALLTAAHASVGKTDGARCWTRTSTAL